jgi:hypothetical protein
MRPFGIDCAVNIPTTARKGKLVAAAVQGIMVGYGYVTGKKGYRVYIPTTRKVVTSYDVTFSDLRTSLMRRRTAQPYLVMSSQQAAEMIEELHPVALQQHRVEDELRTQRLAAMENLPGRGGRVPINDRQHAINDRQPATRQSAMRTPAATAEVVSKVQMPVGDDEQEDEHDNVDNVDNVDYDKPQLDSLPTGWSALPADDPFFDEDGIHATVPVGPFGPVANRTRSARAAANSIASRNNAAHESKQATANFVSDCVPAYVAAAGAAAQDLAVLHQTPKHYRGAVTSTDHWYWRAAITKELQAITDAGVYELVPASSLPAGTNVVGYTWVFRIKHNEDGSVARYKARLCCDGSRQKAGVDYDADKLYAPVANATTIRGSGNRRSPNNVGTTVRH